MNVEIPKRKCPFCKKDAYIVDVEIESEFPEDRLEVRCEICGEFHLLSKMIRFEEGEMVIDSLKGKKFDVTEISRVNKYALSEGKMVLWLDAFNDVIKWEEINRQYAEHYAGVVPYEVRVVIDFEEKN
ncbi:MAG: hypothetical protein VX777_01965 [Chlamydiota bacterium]|nr:hypothetical protein [Chlamydiota bacterium]